MIASTAGDVAITGIALADVALASVALASVVIAGVVSVVGDGGLRARRIGAAAVLADVALADVVAIGLRVRWIGAAAGVLAADRVIVAGLARLGSSGTRKRSSSCRGAACASRRRSI